ncbi:MAG: YihY family inner membrane protein [Candidatus Eisenbacteria bacterium]|nr:YihY family inner membrane protein [Candidatus Latescibacterota bacterium]MBD3300948.1 YihY family inner membrane protein [Candidatus Eisenbacteria bacterium]
MRSLHTPINSSPEPGRGGRLRAVLEGGIRSALRWVGRVVAEVWSSWHRHRCNQLGAAIAYYGIFSMAPLLLLLASVFGYILAGWEGAASFKESIDGLISEGVSPEVARVAVSALNATEAARGELGLIAVAFLVFAAMGAFVQLEMAVQVVWDVHLADKPVSLRRQVLNFLRTRLASFLLMGGVAILIFLSLVTSVFLDLVRQETLAGLDVNGRFTELMLGLFATGWIVTILYRWLPSKPVPWRAALIGGWLTAILWELARQALSSYLTRKDYANAYPVLGSALALLLWVYVAALVFLLGAEVASAITRLLIRARAERERKAASAQR